MNVSVIIPYRSGCEHRARVWRYISGRWKTSFPGWQIIVAADDEHGPWRKGAAVRRGLELATAELVAIADADVWCSSSSIAAAVEFIRAGAPWAMPFKRVLRLNEQATALVLSGRRLEDVGPLRRSRFERSYVQNAAGGLVILPRTTALSIPMDPRFAGWGQEDEAWREALETIAGRRARVEKTLYHLFHPPAPRLTRAVGSEESVALRRRYVDARGRSSAMREILSEIPVA